jgi:ATP-dependent Clp protease ATP-binding subunit ClpA
MFERFSRDARAVVVAAQAVARSLHDPAIRGTHLLVGLAEVGRSTSELLAEHHIGREELLRRLAEQHRGGLDEAALSALGIDLSAVRTSVESTFGTGALDADPPPPRRWPFGRRRASGRGHLPFTDGARKALELSLREAIRLGLDSIDAEAVLLGVLRSDDREVRTVLDDAGVDVAVLRRATEGRLRRSA